jgi:hypothetical protein
MINYFENWFHHNLNTSEYIDIDDATGARVCSISLEFTNDDDSEKCDWVQEGHDKAKRIVTCINGCAGIPNEYLDNGLIRQLLKNHLEKESIHIQELIKRLS